MSSRLSRAARTAVAAAAVGALALSGCSSGNGNKGSDDRKKDGKDASGLQGQVAFGDAKQSAGPATPVPGATEGGTIRVFQRDSFDHLDPAQIYVSDESLMHTLLGRGMTTYRVEMDGSKTVVGDLATDSGTSSEGGRTWKFTLKEGVKFEDGSPITSKDFRHTYERMFAPFITEGPAFVQQWLADTTSTGYRKLLPGGPYTGKHLPDTLLETPDDRTVVFHFSKPRPDLPYALAMAGYGIVQASKDTKEKYDSAPVASGPYRIASYKPGKSMKLVKNENWEPGTDPARHQYVDGFDITFNHQAKDSTQRLLADNAENRTAISFTNAVEPTLTQQVLSDPSASKRIEKGYQPYVWQMNMNMNRLKDKRVREAITYAMPNKQVLNVNGGVHGGEIAPNLFAPTLAGHERNYDPYGKLKKPTGDIAKAKRLLKEAGRTGMKLVYAYANTDARQKESVVIADALEKAGFDVQKKEVDSATWYSQMSKVKNGYDIYMTGWGQDWPSASTVIPPSFDGAQIADGASNYSHVDDSETNAEITRILALTDPVKASAEWTRLHHHILEDVLPAVPVFYTKQMQLYGSKIGGTMFNDVINYIDPTKLYIKK